MKKINVKERSFEALRKSDCIYVDKTKYVYDLVNDMSSSYYSVARPDGFGKSLMCSTLHCLFEGKRELFKGLYIDSTDYSFEKYPVLHFNFGEFDTTNYESFHHDFQRAIYNEAEKNGITLEKEEPSEMLNWLLYEVDKKVVIIIDDHDAPISRTYKNVELRERIRETLSFFYNVIKNTDEKIRFFFMTGVTKYTCMTIFSGFNNVTDITFDLNYASAFGYTEEELESNFSEYIDEYMKRKDREYETREDFIEAIRDYFGGYRFSYESDVKVYNPASVGSFFKDGCFFKPYPVDTETGTLAMELAEYYKPDSIIYSEPILSMRSINSFDYSILSEEKISNQIVLTLMYFTGCLTIEAGDYDGFTLTFPNTETRKAFNEDLAERFC